MSQKDNILEKESITLRPHFCQWLIESMSRLCVTAAGFAISTYVEAPLSRVLLALSIMMSIFLLYRLAYMMSINYQANDQQLIVSYGILSRKRQFMELYRVVDYDERQGVLQTLAGLKTVTIHSTDRSSPTLDIIGIGNCVDIISWLRPRVEQGRRRMGIHEFTNY